MKWFLSAALVAVSIAGGLAVAGPDDDTPCDCPMAKAEALAATAGSSASTGTQAKRTAEITFRKGALIEAAFFRVKPGQQAALDKEYFAKVMPLAQRYGMKPLGMFKVSKIEHGPDDAAMWGLFEWPDEAAKERFEKDPQFAELRPIRDAKLDTLKMVYLNAEETTTVKLRDDRMYEIFGAWVNRHNAPKLKAYFDVAGPWVGQRGAVFPVKLKVVGAPEGHGFLPQRVGFIEWPEGVKAAWFASPEFAKVGHLRARALDRLYVVESHFMFPPES